MNTRKRFCGLAALVAAAALVCGATTARAQDVEQKVVKPYAVKLGTFIPTDGHMKAQASNTWWYVGADYFPDFRYKLMKARVGIGADFRFRDTAGFSIFSDSVTIKFLWDLTGPESKTRVYAGLGAGAYIINTPAISSTIQPGIKVILGADLTDRIFVEGNFDWVSGYSDNNGVGLNANGVSAAIGVRF